MSADGRSVYQRLDQRYTPEERDEHVRLFHAWRDYLPAMHRYVVAQRLEGKTLKTIGHELYRSSSRISEMEMNAWSQIHQWVFYQGQRQAEPWSPRSIHMRAEGTKNQWCEAIRK